MLDAQNGAMMILPMQISVHSIFSHHQHNIKKPNLTINNSFCCIDLIFCNNLRTVSNYGVNLSIFEKMSS